MPARSQLASRERKAAERPLRRIAEICIDAPGTRARAGEHQTQQPLRVPHGIGLREDATEGVSEDHPLV